MTFEENVRWGLSRGALESLDTPVLQERVAAVMAEVRRRGLVADEQHRQWALQLEENRSRDTARAVRVVELEADYQHAEAMSVAWAERADAIRRGSMDAPVPPVDIGALLDEILRSSDDLDWAGQLRPLDTQSWSVYRLRAAIFRASKIRRGREPRGISEVYRDRDAMMGPSPGGGSA